MARKNAAVKKHAARTKPQKHAAPASKSKATDKREKKKGDGPLPIPKRNSERTRKNFGIGQNLPYKRDISRFMRWPTFVTRQRKKRVLERRLKVPPALHQFRLVLDRTTRGEVFKLLKRYAPETRRQRSARIRAAMATSKSGKTTLTCPPLCVLSGLQQVTRAIEKNKAKLVIIACNVDPIELVMWMPTLCRAQKVPYAIVRDKARLGEVIHQKTATCVALTQVHDEDYENLSNIIRSVNARFTARADLIRRKWGGLQMSLRSRAALRKKRAAQAESTKQ